MALSHGYGVVIGRLASHFIEPPDEEGRWPHYHVHVDTPSGEYECVINLKSRTDIKIEYADTRDVDRAHFAQILDKPEGFHRLRSEPTSGALDVVRHPGLHSLRADLPVQPSHLRWWLENGTDVIQLAEFYLLNVRRVYVFGEPYTSGLGVHNVHMNQGDPTGSPFAAENAAWQDGGMLIEYSFPQPRLSVLLTKFQSQSLATDDLGHPV